MKHWRRHAGRWRRLIRPRHFLSDEASSLAAEEEITARNVNELLIKTDNVESEEENTYENTNNNNVEDSLKKEKLKKKKKRDGRCRLTDDGSSGGFGPNPTNNVNIRACMVQVAQHILVPALFSLLALTLSFVFISVFTRFDAIRTFCHFARKFFFIYIFTIVGHISIEGHISIV